MESSETRREIRQIILWGYADTMEMGEIVEFFSGNHKITLIKNHENQFKIMFKSRDSGTVDNRQYTWKPLGNCWKLI